MQAHGPKAGLRRLLVRLQSGLSPSHDGTFNFIATFRKETEFVHRSGKRGKETSVAQRCVRVCWTTSLDTGNHASLSCCRPL
jgi:hypothetical protein